MRQLLPPMDPGNLLRYVSTVLRTPGGLSSGTPPHREVRRRHRGQPLCSIAHHVDRPLPVPAPPTTASLPEIDVATVHSVTAARRSAGDNSQNWRRLGRVRSLASLPPPNQIGVLSTPGLIATE